MLKFQNTKLINCITIPVPKVDRGTSDPENALSFIVDKKKKI